MFETARQIPLFFAFALLGVILGVIYDTMHLLRFKGGFMQVFADIIFCVCFFCLTAYFVLLLNMGQVRWYFFAGIATGFFLERISIGHFIKIFIDFWIKILYNLSVRVKHIIKAKDRRNGSEKKEKT